MQKFNEQDFKIVGENFEEVFACFQFKYRGYVISATNIGCNRGGYPVDCAIFNETVCETRLPTIEECIEWVNNNEKK